MEFYRARCAARERTAAAAVATKRTAGSSLVLFRPGIRPLVFSPDPSPIRVMIAQDIEFTRDCSTERNTHSKSSDSRHDSDRAASFSAVGDVRHQRHEQCWDANHECLLCLVTGLVRCSITDGRATKFPIHLSPF